MAGAHRTLDPVAQVLPGDLALRLIHQHRVLEAGVDEIVLHLTVVLQVAQRLSALGPVERRLGNVEMAALDQLRHLPEEERSEEHTSELQSIMRTSYAVFCLKKKK